MPARQTKSTPGPYLSEQMLVSAGGRGAAAPSRARTATLYAWAASIPIVIFLYVAIESSFFGDALYLAYGIACILLVLAGIRLNAPEPRRPWWIFLTGLTLYVGGDAIYTVYTYALDETAPTVSTADLAYLTGMLLMTIGVSTFVRARAEGKDRTALVDSLILATGFGLVAWTSVMTHVIADTDLTRFERIVFVTYPMLDVVMLATLARMAFSPGARTVSFFAFSAAFSMLFVSDIISNLLSFNSRYWDAQWIDSFWLTVYGLTAIAALHPSMRSLTKRVRTPRESAPRQRLWLLAGASLLGPVAFIAQDLQGDALDVPVIAAGSAFMTLLVIQRLRHVVMAQREIAQRERVLREATARFASAKDPVAVVASVRQAIDDMSDRITVHLLTENGDDTFTLSHEDSGRAERVESVDLDALPADLTVALEQGNPLVVSGDAGVRLQAIGVPLEDQHAIVAPFGYERVIRSAIVASGPAVADAEFRAGILSVAAQASLTLEGAARAEDAIRQQSEARFESLVRQASDIITVLGLDNRVRYSSPAVQRMLGRNSAELVDHELSSIFHADDWARFSRDLEELKTSHQALAQEYRLVHVDGTSRQVEVIGSNLLDDSAVGGIVLNMRDISDRKEAERLLAHQAYHDALTRLPNRALFMDRLDRAIASAIRHSERVGILFMDLDGFKRVNDSLGHEAGDQLLIEISRRLRGAIGSEHTVARLGGDEFTVLIETVDDLSELAALARQVNDLVTAPITLARQVVFVGASIGIAVGDPTRDTAHDMLRMADIAMYRAKADGKGKFQIFQAGMDIEAARQLDLTTDLREAIERGQLRLEYQPQVQLATGRIAGFEALVRWHHPTRGVITPSEFIPLAEETGLIVSIGKWVIDTAAVQANEWLAQFPHDPPIVNVNISARQLAHGDFVGTVSSAIDRHKLPPELLLLELVETTLINDDAATAALLRRLRGLGVRLAIDDFGSAYSSLAYLLHLPISNVKIDRSFVVDLDTEGEGYAIVEAIIGLAHRLKIDVTAEGIETATQVLQLAELNCDNGQGYYFSPAVPAEQATALLENTAAHMQSS